METRPPFCTVVPRRTTDVPTWTGTSDSFWWTCWTCWTGSTEGKPRRRKEKQNVFTCCGDNTVQELLTMTSCSRDGHWYCYSIGCWAFKPAPRSLTLLRSGPIRQESTLQAAKRELTQLDKMSWHIQHKFLLRERGFQTAVNFVVIVTEGLSLNLSDWTIQT